MTQSQHQIDFIHSGGTLRLLDIGAIVDADPVISTKQREERYYPIGAEWSDAKALGGADVSLTWTAVRNHASHAELHAFCIRHAAALPSGKTGSIRLTISGGETWDVLNAVLSSSAPLPLGSSGAFETVTSYSATGGQMVPAAALTLYAGIPWEWILQDWDALTGDWDAL